jgi:hypothetical protein
MNPPRPDPSEYASAFQAYVDRVPDGDVLADLATRGSATASLVARLPAAIGDHAYAPGKWTVKQVLQHVTDGERLFGYRALCIARGETMSLPPFDEDLYARNDGSASRPLAAIGIEFAAVRQATLALFAGLDAAAWRRQGTANGKPASVRSLLWIVAGHERHHLAVLRERYGVG